MDFESENSPSADGPELQKKLEALGEFVEAQRKIAKVTSKCFDRCVASPGKTLSSYEESCIWKCSQRFIDVEHFLTRRLEAKSNSGAAESY